MVGFVDEDLRHRFYIAAAYLSRGEVVHVHHKVYLPTYGLFDEGRFFAWGDAVAGLRYPLWARGHADLRGFLARLAALPALAGWRGPVAVHLGLARARADREPQLESARWVEHINRAYASLFTILCRPHQPGGYEDGLNFWGGSTVFDPNGEPAGQGPLPRGSADSWPKSI